MEEPRKYEQLKPDERMVIASLRLQGASMRSIARTLGRPASTVCRELRRNTCPDTGYVSDRAQTFHAARRAAARPARKLDVRSINWSVVLSMLDWKWSPQQIAEVIEAADAMAKKCVLR